MKGPKVPVEEIFVEWGSLVVIHDERVIGLNREENFLLRRIFQAWAINLPDAKIQKKRENDLVLDYHQVNSNVTYLGHAGVRR